jgi:hypothetical protein
MLRPRVVAYRSSWSLDWECHGWYSSGEGLMAGTRKAGPTRHDRHAGVLPARTPGPLGTNDQADTYVLALQGDTPGPVGVGDFEPPRLLSAPVVGTGVASVARIRVPGTDYFVELSPRNFPASKSTSALFIQDQAAKRVLRLDYGYNKRSGQVDYHWNQKGTFADFGIEDHTGAGSVGEALFKGAKLFKYGGRVLLIAGIAMDAYSIVVAKKRWRQVVRVAAGWAGAAAGAEYGGLWGAGFGSAEPGAGTAIGGIVGSLVGGIAGYAGASWAVGETYDWVEETYFEPIQPNG